MNKQLLSFIQFCEENPELRFWQALSAWSGKRFILTSSHFDTDMFNHEFMKENKVKIEDTFYVEEPTVPE